MIEHIFPGQTEMARRMRAMDWSQTTLGPVDLWPESLRTSVSTCLDCAFPIVIWWGPKLAILYNDEYAQIMGPAKHPAALGQPGAHVWAEIWDVISPMLAQVMEQAEPTRSRDLLLQIDRGYVEEAYFSFSYSPIHEQGKVGGIFCPVIETTEKVIGERRLRTLRDLAARCKGAVSEASVYEAAAAVLRANLHDIPFSLIYQVDDRQATAELKSASGIAPGTAAARNRLTLDDATDHWSLGHVARTGERTVLADLRAKVDGLPTGAWRVAADSAVVLPVLLPGQERARTILVAAVSPLRALDEDYRTFFGLIATQIAAALADAQAIAEERRRAEALAEIDRAKTAFFSNVSHEFRTPLTLMIGPLEDLLASHNGQLPVEAVSAVSVAHRNGLRLLKLVNTLLDFSRLEAGRIDASYQPTDLSAFTIELASVFRSAIERAGLRLRVACPSLDEPVYVDHDMWEKIVLNLLSNAFKFTLNGEIAVSLQQKSGAVELSVSDTGVGIAPQELPRVFQRFHRVRQTRARTHEGTGIGLALVQELTRLHGGSVSVTSIEDQGTTFSVTIPLGTAHLPTERIAGGHSLAPTAIGADAFVEEALRWLPKGEAPGERGRDALLDIPEAVAVPSALARRARVLVVDDNADMCDYVTRILASNHAVEAVADGAVAFQRVIADPPDLVLSDVMMPELDGFGLLDAIRADPRCRSIPVILLSARAGEEARIEGLDRGADDYLVKPFSARELLARVGSQLQLATLRWDAQRTIAESERRLREADRRKDEFLALLAHELRNPLAPVRTGLELIRLAGDTPESIRRVRSMMERQIGQMVRLIDDLLDVSRITSGKIVLQRRPTTLTELVQGAVDAQKEAIDASHIVLTVTLPEKPCLLAVDPTRFVQVLSNVLQNASKFTPPGGSINLTAHTVDRDQELRIIVSDSGVGIAPEMLPHIFELFTQAESPTERSQGGLGIGLALARRLVELHGGRISGESAGPGLGSTFTITLPLTEAIAEVPATPHADLGRITDRVVIIDDNADAATTLAMLIEELGGSARTANEALSGLQAVKEFQPDVVFLDVGMPGMNGYEACRRIRGIAASRPATIVAVTGWGQEQDKKRAVDAGFDHHMTKPVDPAALVAFLTSRHMAPIPVERAIVPRNAR